MTCEERYMKDHPECEEFSAYSENVNCPHEYGYAPCDDCDSFRSCADCWNQPAIGVTVEEDEAPNIHHKYVWDEEDLRLVSPSDLTAGFVKGMQDAAKASEGSPIKDLAKAISDIENCHIKDSGERRQFETGAVRDIQEGKGRCDLLPLDVVVGMYEYNDDVSDPERAYIFNSIYRFTKTSDTFFLYSVLGMFVERYDTYADMILEVSKHFEEGAKKYGEYNWQKGIPTHCYIDSAVRHYLKYLRGDTDEPHDRAFVWNILCCIWTCIHKPELNDYRKAEEDV